jgi:hypothetical protein
MNIVELLKKKQEQIFKTLVGFSFGCMIFVCACSVVAPCLGETTQLEAAAQEKRELFDLIARLEKVTPFKRNTVEQLTGRPFSGDPNIVPLPWQNQDPIEDFFTPRDRSRFVSRISMREPAKPSKDQGGFVALEINSDLYCITFEEIINHFGKESFVDKHPLYDMLIELQPVRYEYKRSWGRLVFSVSREEPRCLSEVLLSTYSQ